MSVTQKAQHIEKMAREKEAFLGRVLDGAKALKNRFISKADDAARSMPTSPADGGSKSMTGRSVPASGPPKSMTTPSGRANKSMPTSPADGGSKSMPTPGDETGYAEAIKNYKTEIGAGAAGLGAGAAGMGLLGDKEGSVRRRFGLSSDSNEPEHSGELSNRFSRSLAP